MRVKLRDAGGDNCYTLIHDGLLLKQRRFCYSRGCDSCIVRKIHHDKISSDVTVNIGTDLPLLGEYGD